MLTIRQFRTLRVLVVSLGVLASAAGVLVGGAARASQCSVGGGTVVGAGGAAVEVGPGNYVAACDPTTGDASVSVTPSASGPVRYTTCGSYGGPAPWCESNTPLSAGNGSNATGSDVVVANGGSATQESFCTLVVQVRVCHPGVTVSNGGNATNYYGAGVSTNGKASSGDVAVSGTGDAASSGYVAVSGTGHSYSTRGDNGPLLAVSGTGATDSSLAVSGMGSSHGTVVGISGTCGSNALTMLVEYTSCSPDLSDPGAEAAGAGALVLPALQKLVDAALRAVPVGANTRSSDDEGKCVMRSDENWKGADNHVRGKWVVQTQIACDFATAGMHVWTRLYQNGYELGSAAAYEYDKPVNRIGSTNDRVGCRYNDCRGSYEARALFEITLADGWAWVDDGDPDCSYYGMYRSYDTLSCEVWSQGAL